MRLRPLEEARSLSTARFYGRWYRHRRPVVIRDAAASWPALSRWTDPYLIERVGDRLVVAYRMSAREVTLDPQTGFRQARLSLRQFMSGCSGAEEARYFMRASLDHQLKALARDAPIPSFCQGGLELRRNLWASAKGMVTQLHFDLPDNLIVQIRGTKRFTLFPPSQRPFLKPFPWLSSTPHLAGFDPIAAASDGTPRPSGTFVTLSPGDALYLPPRYWHHAVALQSTVSVNHWWCRPMTRVLLGLSDAYKRLRGLQI